MFNEEIFIPLGLFAMVAFIVWVAAREKQAKVQARTELNRQLLDKFSSAQELTDFLERESGQRFLDGIGSEAQQLAKKRILGIIVPACVLTSLGAGFLILGSKNPDPGLWIGGIAIFASGVGLMIAAALTYGLSKAWGLMNGSDRPGGQS